MKEQGTYIHLCDSNITLTEEEKKIVLYLIQHPELKHKLYLESLQYEED